MGTRPSSWVNLQDYLQLNGQQGQDMGERVYENVAGKGKKAEEQLLGAEQGYNEAVHGGTVQGPTFYDPDHPESADNPTEAESAANAAKRYSGPTSLSEYDKTLEGNVGSAAEQMKLASDQSTRMPIVQETFGGRSGSGLGGSSLDNFLVGQSAAGQQLDALGPKYKQLLSGLGMAESSADAVGKAAEAKSAENANKWALAGDDTKVRNEQAPRIAQRRTQYQTGGYVGTFGRKDDFANNMIGGDPNSNHGKMSFGGLEVSPQQMGKLLATQLDIQPQELQKAIRRMTDQEYGDMMVSGVVPNWLKGGPKATSHDKNTFGGIKTPYLAASDKPDIGGAVLQWDKEELAMMAKLIAAVV